MKNIATYGNKNFPIVLREMEYPEITQAELHKYLKNIKKNKATGPAHVKGELYRALGRSEMCVHRKTTDNTPEYNRQGFINKIMGKIIHQTNTESQETNSQADETN